jgi:hypothetical protein
MSDAIKQMLEDRERAREAHDMGLRRELIRRLVDSRKARFVTSFQRQARYYRERHDNNGRSPRLSLDTEAVCEGADLAQDPGWDAERAWRFSLTREKAIAEVEAELERRRG